MFKPTLPQQTIVSLLEFEGCHIEHITTQNDHSWAEVESHVKSYITGEEGYGVHFSWGQKGVMGYYYTTKTGREIVYLSIK